MVSVNVYDPDTSQMEFPGPPNVGYSLWPDQGWAIAAAAIPSQSRNAPRSRVMLNRASVGAPEVLSRRVIKVILSFHPLLTERDSEVTNYFRRTFLAS